MFHIKNDKEYMLIIDDIIKNSRFNELKKIEHHGTTRFDHSLRVSYYSYKISKKLGLDYMATARAGLLHDFFLSDEDRTIQEKFISTFTHPKKAVENAIMEFQIDGKQMDIIRSHMFPLNLSIPKYIESWLVSTVDKMVGTYEFGKKFNTKLVYATNLFIILLINNMK